MNQASYYIHWKGSSTGPYRKEQIEEMLKSGSLSPLHTIMLNGTPIDSEAWLHDLSVQADSEQQLQSMQYDLESEIARSTELNARMQEEFDSRLNDQQRKIQELMQENERLKASKSTHSSPTPPPIPKASQSNSTNQTQKLPHTKQQQKSRLAYVLLGLFLGFFGVHNFYAGYTNKGITQLLLVLFLFWTGVVPLVVCVWNIIEICTVSVDANGVPMS